MQQVLQSELLLMKSLGKRNKQKYWTINFSKDNKPLKKIREKVKDLIFSL
jgi:hypothetical protein